MKPRRHIAATSLKVLRENIYSAKSYDKNKHENFALSLWENSSWGLTYFDQFITTGEVFTEPKLQVAASQCHFWPNRLYY